MGDEGSRRRLMDPAPLEMFTIRGEAVDLWRSGAKKLVTTAGPVAFVSKASRICWRRGGVWAPMPALLTSMSSLPWLRSTVVAACSMVSSLVTSIGTISTEPGRLRDCRSFTAALPLSGDLDPMSTWYEPFDNNCAASSKPMPLFAWEYWLASCASNGSRRTHHR